MKKSKLIFLALLLALIAWVGAGTAAAQDSDEETQDTSEEATSDEATSDEATSEEATSEEATSEEATSEEATSEEATSEEATSEEETEVDEGTDTAGEGTSEDADADDADADDADANDAPGTIVDVAVAAGNFSTLVNAVQAAGLADTLSGPGPFTVFAPTEEAFATALETLNLSAEDLLADTELLASVLTYHVLPRSVPAATVRTLDGQSVQTVQGANVTISVDGDAVQINNNANVVTPDIQASNGIIHVIDAVLLPPSGDDASDDMDMADDMSDNMDDMSGEELAATGVNTSLLTIIALAVVLAGAMLFGLGRRLRNLQ